MIKNKIIYIIGTFKYPYGEAASTRLTMLAKAIQHVGGIVTIVTCGKQQTGASIPSAGMRDGIPYTVLNGLGLSSASRILNGIKRFIFARTSLTGWLEDEKTPKPDLVILYGASAWIGSGIVNWGHHHAVPVIFDVVEWYDVHQCWGGYLGPFFYDSELFMRWVSKKGDGVIAISNYLETYYKRDGLPVIRVPGMVDLTKPLKVSVEFDINKPFTVLYSGFPGKKDMLTPLLDAAKLLSKTGKNIRFVFTGRDIEQALHQQGWEPASLKQLDNVEFLGWLSEKDMELTKESSDAMVVFRTAGKSSLANFPQKFAEYMGSGHPVIVNNIGDMPIYVKHEINGLIVCDLSAQSVADAILSLAERQDRGRSLGLQGWTTAMKAFDYRSISEPLANFISSIIQLSGKSRTGS